jgi:hypothetical protein
MKKDKQMKIGDALDSVVWMKYMEKVSQAEMVEGFRKNIRGMSRKMVDQIIEYYFNHYDFWLAWTYDNEKKGWYIQIDIRPKQESIKEWLQSIKTKEKHDNRK